MKLAKTKAFVKKYKKLPKNVQKKTDKQLFILLKDFRHPSLHVKKLQGYDDVWEGRIDRFYRFAFTIEANAIILLRVGPHDTGLGKK